MPIRQIITDGNPVLRRRAADIPTEMLATKRLRGLAFDLVETMRANKGVGIAAPQVGESLRLFIVDTADGPLALVNPKLTKKSWTLAKDEEGCLSVPGMFGTVKRHRSVHVEALTLDGQPVKFTAKGFFARVIQHENDHLDGILFTDRIKEQGGSTPHRVGG